MSAPRSVLYVPAFRAERLATAPFLAADAYVVDLEDGIAPDEKERARETLRRCAEVGAFRELPLWMLRVNPPGTPWQVSLSVWRSSPRRCPANTHGHSR